MNPNNDEWRILLSNPKVVIPPFNLPISFSSPAPMEQAPAPSAAAQSEPKKKKSKEPTPPSKPTEAAAAVAPAVAAAADATATVEKPKSTPKAEKPPPTPEQVLECTTLVKLGEECLEPSELQQLVQFRSGAIRFYDGFEPSGRMHIAQGVFKSLNVNTCTKSGVFVFWVADFFALMNDKMGGDLAKIKVVGEYLVEVWKAAGMDLAKVEILWASDEIVRRSADYMTTVCDIARRFTLARLVKCCQIMGRKEGNLTAAQVLYPLMQCADVFFLQADVCQLGMDQRKVNMLARDYAHSAGKRFKPVILSHHMLFGLKQGQEKMSKSDADSAIFMEDTKSEVERKINSAYCPTSGPELLVNPLLDYIQHICFHPQNSVEFAQGKFTTPKQVVEALESGMVSPDELKRDLAEHLNLLLEPVRAKFGEPGSRPKELLELVTQYKAEAVAAALVQPNPELDLPEDVEIARARRKQDKPEIRRVKPSKLAGAKAGTVVFLPPPRMHSGIVLEDVVSCVVRLSAPVTDGEGPRVLFVSDYGMICQNCLADGDTANKKKQNEDSPRQEIEAYVQVFLQSVKLLISPEISYVVIKQSELMGEDPLNYLLCVINVGRAFKLDAVCDFVCKPGDTEPQVGPIIASLFMVADVLALGPPSQIVHSTAEEGRLVSLCQAFFDTEFASKYDCGGPSPVRVPVSVPDLRMLRTEDATANVESIPFVIDDGVKKKLKLAFCEEGNVQFNPLLSGWLALWEVEALKHLFQPTFQVTRPAEFGGNVVFSSCKQVFAALADKTLHPGDFKSTLQQDIVLRVYDVLKSLSGTCAGAIKLLEACKKRNPERII
ncbi:hypothetical protein BASA81_005939 [Batrachochytrium salamandrivorans]|nr:hypothetical protein BASA81_005939 [Batrachochytrium salamandrivorans]